VQESEEAHAEAEAERARHFRLVVQRGIVEPQLRQRIAEFVVVVRDDREHSGEHAGLHLLEARQCLGGLLVFERDGVAHRRAIDFLDAADDETHIARAERSGRDGLRGEPAELVDQVGAARGHHADLVVDLERAVEDAHQRDDADVVVEPGVDDQRLQRRIRITLGLGNAFDEALEQIFDALAGLRGYLERIGGGNADDLLDFIDDARRVGRWQVYLVDDRDDFEPELGGRIAIRDTLRLDALGSIDHQQRAIAGRQRA
jgi:hypothetical protein